MAGLPSTLGLKLNPMGFNTPELGYQPQDIITDYAQRLLPLIHGEQRNQQTLNTELSNRIRLQKQNDDLASRGQNVVLKDAEINPLQKAKLNLAQEAEEGKNSRASDALAARGSNNDAQNAIRKQRADAYSFKETHPNMTFKIADGGNLIGIDPITGSTMDTGINTGAMSEQEKLEFIQKGKMAQIGAEGANAANVQNLRNAGSESVAKERSNSAMANTTARIAGAKSAANNKPQSATDARAMYANKAQQLANDPRYNKFIAMDPGSGKFTINPDTPDDVFHDINSQIYGNGIGGQDVELPSNSNSGSVKADPAGIR